MFQCITRDCANAWQNYQYVKDFGVVVRKKFFEARHKVYGAETSAMNHELFFMTKSHFNTALQRQFPAWKTRHSNLQHGAPSVSHIIFARFTKELFCSSSCEKLRPAFLKETWGKSPELCMYKSLVTVLCMHGFFSNTDVMLAE